jgi:hypothetical protein
MTRDRRPLFRAFLVIAVLAFVARNLATDLWYGSTTLDWAGATIELPGWTDARIVTQLEQLRKEQPDGVLVSDASNVANAWVEGSSLGGRPLLFFSSFMGPYSLTAPVNLGDRWAKILGNQKVRAPIISEVKIHNRAYDLHVAFDGESWHGPREFDEFPLDPRLVDAVEHPGHTFLLESLNWTLLNHWKTPGLYSERLTLKPYTAVSNFLINVASGKSRPSKMIWRFEPDVLEAGKSFEAVGRYLLFHIVNPTKRVRLVLDYTASIQSDGKDSIPEASILGDGRVRVPAAGSGAARLFSPPISPQLVDGLPFIELDMGRDGTEFPDRRSGLMKLYGNELRFDDRRIVGFIRDISVVSDEDYHSLRAPRMLADFPDGLEDPNLEFSGIYEDGWMADRAVLWLSAPDHGQCNLTLRALVPSEALSKTLSVRVTLDGRTVALERPLAGGDLIIQVLANGDGRRHEIGIEAGPVFHLPGVGGRPASIRLRSIGFD